jgi:sirohydrochlorin cobaltochelatase
MAGDTTIGHTPPQSGIVFFAHGSRDPLWRAPIEAVAKQLQQLHPSAQCLCAYLELNSPDLAAACQHLVTQGCLKITVLPMFLGTGRHARNDLPQLVQALQVQHPAVAFSIAIAVGEDPRVTQLLAAIAAEHIA